MSGEKEKVELGDLLAAGCEPQEAVEIPSTYQDAERLLLNLAAIANVDPADVLAEYRKGGPLARLLTGLFGFADRPDKFWTAYDAVEKARADGLTGRAAFEEATRQIWTRDVLGHSEGTLSSQTVKQYHKEAKALLSKHSSSIGSWFLPAVYRPPRRRRKQVTDETN